MYLSLLLEYFKNEYLIFYNSSVCCSTKSLEDSLQISEDLKALYKIFFGEYLWETLIFLPDAGGQVRTWKKEHRAEDGQPISPLDRWLLSLTLEIRTWLLTLLTQRIGGLNACAPFPPEICLMPRSLCWREVSLHSTWGCRMVPWNM